jgi:hypothetical protein
MLKRTRKAFFRNATALVPDLIERARNDFNQFRIPKQYLNECSLLLDPLPTILEELAARFRLLHAMIDELREFTVCPPLALVYNWNLISERMKGCI